MSRALRFAEESATEQVVDFLDTTWMGTAIVVVLIVLLALIARWLWHRFMRRTTATVTQSAVTRDLATDRQSPRDRDIAIERYRARTTAVAGLVTSVGTFVIVAVALLFGLSELGVDVAPLIASAGIESRRDHH